MPCERKHIEAIAYAVDELWCIDTAQNYDLCGAAISAALAAIDESPWRWQVIERKHIEEFKLLAMQYKDGRIPKARMLATLNALADSALAAIDESPWRSMDSAPRDGTPILMKFAHGWPAVGSWFSTNTDGWWVCGCLPVYPTHWMHLPAESEVKS